MKAWCKGGDQHTGEERRHNFHNATVITHVCTDFTDNTHSSSLKMDNGRLCGTCKSNMYLTIYNIFEEIIGFSNMCSSTYWETNAWTP